MPFLQADNGLRRTDGNPHCPSHMWLHGEGRKQMSADAGAKRASNREESWNCCAQRRKHASDMLGFIKAALAPRLILEGPLGVLGGGMGK